MNTGRLTKLNTVWTALVLTAALLAGVVGLGFYSVRAAENGGYKVEELDVRKAKDNNWYTYDKATNEQVLKYTGVAKNSKGWWRVENGKVNFKANGIYYNEKGYWYVKDGKVNFSYSGYLQTNNYVNRTNGAPLYSDEKGNPLNKPVTTKGTNTKTVSTDKAFWRVDGGKLQVGYTGARKGYVKGEYAWWRVENGRVNTKYKGVARNENGWYYFENGRVNFDYTGVAKNDYGWWRIENGKLNTDYNGIASNEYGSWYLKGGKVDFSYSGALVIKNTMYVVEKGKVVSSEKLNVTGLPDVRPNVRFFAGGAELSWTDIRDENGQAVDGYEIYEKTSPYASWSKIGTVGARTLKFSCSFGFNVDPTANPRLYDVRAIQKNEYGIVDSSSTELKPSAQNNYIGGSFALAPPAIVSVKDSGNSTQVTFKEVPYATSYSIYYGNYDSKGNAKLTFAGSAAAQNSGAGSSAKARSGFQKKNQTVTVNRKSGFQFLTVQAVYTEKVNNKTIFEQKSVYDPGFELNQTQLQGKKILFLGDSILEGTPYGPTSTDYTIPTRVALQTGASVYNAAVAGAVIVSDYPRIISNSVLHNQTMLAADGTHANFRNGKWKDVQDLSDFDIVVLEGGANDYSNAVPLGAPDSTKVSEFYGALNKHMALLKEASQKRVEAGKAPTQVVLMDILYANRYGAGNKLGLNYSHYQAALKATAEAYANDPDMLVYWYTGQTAVLSKSNYRYETVDYLHPTAFCYGQVGNHMAAFLKTIQTD